MTNFYPYYINTGLFSGFSPKLRFIIPTLDQHYVIGRMHQAIMAEEHEVYIRGMIYWIKIVLLIVPSFIRRPAIQALVGDGM